MKRDWCGPWKLNRERSVWTREYREQMYPGAAIASCDTGPTSHVGSTSNGANVTIRWTSAMWLRRTAAVAL